MEIAKMAPSVVIPASWIGLFFFLKKTSCQARKDKKKNQKTASSVCTSAYGLVGVVSCTVSLSLSIILSQGIILFFFQVKHCIWNPGTISSLQPNYMGCVKGHIGSGNVSK